MIAFHDVLTALAQEAGVDATELTRTQELVIDDQVIGLYLDGENDALNDPDARPDARAGMAADAGPDSEHTTYVVYFTLLGAIDPAPHPRVLRTLLEANHLWAGTAGCTLGMQPGSGQVMLCGQLPLAFLTGADLCAVLASFAETAAFWRRFVTGTAAVEVDDVGALPFLLA